MPEIIDYRGCIINVQYDSDPQNPRTDQENAAEMICAHNRYRLGDRQEVMTQAEIQEYAAGGVYLPIYMMDHSGLAFSTAPFACPWDSGQVGWIVMTGKKVQECFSGLSLEEKGRAIALMRSEVETYDQYQRGCIYEYSVEDSLGNSFASCGGFYPETGSLNHPAELVEQAKAEIDSYLERIKVTLSGGRYEVILGDEDGGIQHVTIQIGRLGDGILSDREGRRYVPYFPGPVEEPTLSDLDPFGPNAYLAITLKGDVYRVLEAKPAIAQAAA